MPGKISENPRFSHFPCLTCSSQLSAWSVTSLVHLSSFPSGSHPREFSFVARIAAVFHFLAVRKEVMLSCRCQQQTEERCVPSCDCGRCKHQIPLAFTASLLPWPLAPAGAAVAFVHEAELAALPAVTVHIETKLNWLHGAHCPGAAPVPA